MTSRPLGRRRVVSSIASFSVLTTVALHAFVACGGDEASSAPPPGSAGSGGTAGGASAGGKAGAAGASGGSGGSVGGGAGTSGAAGGAAGTAGVAAGGAAGTSGAGAGGSAGAAAGVAGAAGGGGCKVDADCPATLSTQPANCAKAKCNSGTCGFVAGDADGDGHGAARCKSNDPLVTVTLGDDCDDANKDISPEGWDGPAGEGRPNHCNDGIDQDCSGLDDDQKLTNGATCTCTPGDVEPCSQTSSGKTVTFPVLKDGKPLAPCVLGSRTCLAGGKWGACTDIREPDTETCDNVDNDCNGVIDDNAVDKPTWAWDADGDLHGATDCPTVQACPSAAPTDPPTGCKSATCDKVKCPTAQWRSTLFFKADDCDDTVTANYPGNVERCDQVDNDCDGTVDEGADGKAGGICACSAGDPPVACYSGPQGLKLTAPAICREGTSTCKLDGTAGECTGQVLPSAELCNELDDDCDGDVDEGFGTLDANKKAIPCTVDNKPGACVGAGILACAPNGTSILCKNVTPGVGVGGQEWHATPSPTLGNSPDWACDNVPEFQPYVNGVQAGGQINEAGTAFFTRNAASCGNAAVASLCAQLLPVDCRKNGARVIVQCADDGNNPPLCGQPAKMIGCSYEEPIPADGVKGGCYANGSVPTDAVLYCR